MRSSRTNCFLLGLRTNLQMHGAGLANAICMLALASGCGGPDQLNQVQTIALSLLTDQAAAPAEQTQSMEAAEFRVQGCASLFTSTVRVSGMKSALKLNYRDEGCTVYLRSFRWRGMVWKMRDGGIFAGAGKADFISTASSSVVQVSNPRNLSPILSIHDQVSFSFKYVLLGQAGSVFEKGARGEVVSHYDSRPGPFLKWPERGIAIELSDQLLSLRLECSGSLKIAENIRDTECVSVDGKRQIQRQSLADLYFMIKQKSPDWKATLPSLIFSFMANRSGEVVKILKKEDIWQDSQTGRAGITLNFPLEQGFKYNVESGCLRLLALHKKRFSRVGYWAFVWFNFGLGSERAVCSPEPDSPAGYDPDYSADSEIPSDSSEPHRVWF